MDILGFLRTQDWALLLAAFLPILGWITYFQYLNRERTKHVVLAFVAGMISVVTMKSYERYWDTGIAWLTHTDIFLSLAELINSPTISQFFAFVSLSSVVAIGMFLFVAVLMFALEVGTGENSIALFFRKFRCIAETPSLFIFAGLIMGVAAWGSWVLLPIFVWKALMVGALEEYVKHLCLRFADEDKIVNFDDAISFSVMVALGFAFAENYLYFKQHLNDPYIFRGVFILRSSLSVLAHVGFSAIFGYFYGLAHFSDEIYQDDVRHGRHPILRWFHRTCHLRGASLFHEEMMLEGMAIAMLLHAAYNSLLEGHSIQAALPVVFGMFFVVLNLYHRKHLHHRRGHILQE